VAAHVEGPHREARVDQRLGEAAVARAVIGEAVVDHQHAPRGSPLTGRQCWP
jgi:hypothetical protein